MSRAGPVRPAGGVHVSTAIDVPVIDRIVLTWDVQSGHSALGATGSGACFYITPTVDLLTGPVFFERELQPGGSSWMWSLQLDVDLDLRPEDSRLSLRYDASMIVNPPARALSGFPDRA